jgi:hypothetical protein
MDTQKSGAPGVIRTRDPRIRSAKKPYTPTKAMQQTQQNKAKSAFRVGCFWAGLCRVRAQFGHNRVSYCMLPAARGDDERLEKGFDHLDYCYFGWILQRIRSVAVVELVCRSVATRAGSELLAYLRHEHAFRIADCQRRQSGA